MKNEIEIHETSMKLNENQWKSMNKSMKTHEKSMRNL